MTRPAVWPAAAGACIQYMSAGQDGYVGARVALVWCHVTNRTVTMLAVVPAHETIDPAVRGLMVSEGQARVRRRVLERAEQRLGVRVVVADMRSTEGGDDAKPLQRGDHGIGTH